MKISIVTVNRNNSLGLEKTLRSVATQMPTDFELIVIDGASTDRSVEVIEHYAAEIPSMKWISERDTGIYNGMNKGIRMATGEYVMMLNSGDWLTKNDIMKQLCAQIKEHDCPEILYGTTTKIWPNGRTLRNKSSDASFTMFSFYRGTLDHVGTCIKRELFDRYGFYDESLRICSDWAWFMKVVVFGQIKPVHVDVDTVYFDMTGISENNGENKDLIERERRQIIETTLPPLVLADYDSFADDIVLMRRIHRYPAAYKLVRTIERLLFKYEKCRK